MFNFSEYLKKGFIGAIGNKPDYQIRLDSAGWHKAGFLTENDLTEIDVAIEEHIKVDDYSENMY